MSNLEAIVLGLVQGLTEFLPISSTAHLRIVAAFVGWKDPGAAFTAVTQLGTLLAVLVYFRKDLLSLARGTFESLRQGSLTANQEARLSLGIVIGTIPIGVCGLLFQDAIRTSFRSLYVIAGSLIGLAVLLLVAERTARHVRGLEHMNIRDALMVGLAQALALVPGASRSGVTITAGLFIGLKRETAARFSFLLSVPAIGAAGAYEMLKLVRDEGIAVAFSPTILLATAVAFASGWAAIAFLVSFLRRNSTGIFIAYRVGLGVLILGLVAGGFVLAEELPEQPAIQAGAPEPPPAP